MKFRFDEIAFNSTLKKKPVEEDKIHYIGLEHIEPGNFSITEWGSDVAPVGEKLIMKKGDILFGKRRAYQRKVAIAPFDGIFSAHGMVLRPKTDVIDADFFPLFISSDTFMETAMRISVGGLSPTINWKDLKEQEFELPSLEEQQTIAKKAWAAYRLKEAYQRLLSATDEMVKSQFIEWFGNVTETTSLSSLIAESYPGEWGKEAKNNNGVKVLRTTNFQNNGHIDYSDVIVRYIEQKKIEKKCLRTGDIILERSGGTKDNPVGRVVLFEAEGEYMFNNFTQLLRPIKSVNPYYLFFYLHTSYNADKASMRAMASQTTGIQNLNMTDYMAKEIPLPSLEEQEQFERLYRQADKSKYYEINET